MSIRLSQVDKAKISGAKFLFLVDYCCLVNPTVCVNRLEMHKPLILELSCRLYLHLSILLG